MYVTIRNCNECKFYNKSKDTFPIEECGHVLSAKRLPIKTITKTKKSTCGVGDFTLLWTACIDMRDPKDGKCGLEARLFEHFCDKVIMYSR